MRALCRDDERFGGRDKTPAQLYPGQISTGPKKSGFAGNRINKLSEFYVDGILIFLHLKMLVTIRPVKNSKLRRIQMSQSRSGPRCDPWNRQHPAVIYRQHPAVVYHFLSWPTIVCHRLPLHVIPCHYLPLSAITCHHLPSSTPTCHYLSLPVITCHNLPAPVMVCHL